MAKRKPKPKLVEPPKPRKAKAQPNPLEQTPTDLEEDWADVAPGHKVPRMPRKDLEKFVLDFCTNRIFSTAHMSEHEQSSLLHLVFMPLALGGLQGMFEAEIKNIGLIWEYYDKAGPRSINGCPIFFSCRIMHKDDWNIARKAIHREQERRKQTAASVLDEELGPAPPEEPEPPHDDSDQDPW